MKRSILLSGILLSLLAACGDEVTEVIQSADDSGMTVVAAGEKLSKCSKENVGEMVFVSDSNAVFFCADGKWKSLNGKDGGRDENGKDGNDANVVDTVVISSYDTITVVNVDTLVIRDTLIGLNGADCYAEKITEGYKILCGEDSVGVVRDGADGEDGNPGSDGKDACDLEDDGNGSVTITCGSGENAKSITVFKALCQGVAYDPSDKECVDSGLLKICADSNEGIVEKNTNGSFYTCGGNSWKVATEEEIEAACQTDSLDCVEE